MKLLLTCNPGTEDLVAQEALEELPGSRVIEIRENNGRVVVEANGDAQSLMERIYSMRAIHSAVLLLREARVSMGAEGLEQIRSITAESGVEEYMPLGATFAVEAERIGEGHSYTSIDIASAVGDAVIKAVESRRGWRPLVRLNSPQVVVYAEVDVDTFRVGILLSGERSRHRRGYRVYDHPAALKPTLAYVMLRLAGARDGEVVMDPMCGGGTIAIEAAMLLEGSRVICLDKNPRHVRGAMMNALAARVFERIRFIVGDARRLEDYLEPGSVDVVVTNPPYGIRMGDPTSVRDLYSRFLRSLYNVMAGGGRASIITTEGEYVKRESVKAGFRVTHYRAVRHGDLWTRIVVIEKPGH